ncbi:thymidylate kinase-domain-containing protein [Cladorrhinum samala]|uniref:Thymidylate kinase n=1 Tax=Cladorrhinum samala TaxID=585594 RepID=A0AAV9H7W6_9PEZI|nr:thymidylate kinase-domain-containing protein [Cladorrhinum samala]
MTSTSSTTPVRGAFIVLEGLDRSGKTTQASLLEQRLKSSGRAVKSLRFPDRTTPTGSVINSYLTSSTSLPDHAIHLLFSANRWELAPIIASLLASGTTVVCDRYYHSGIVYSAAKRNPSLSLSWARGPEVGLPRPDLVLFLDLDEDEAKKRGGWGGERYEQAEMQRRVKELFWGLSMGRVVEENAEAPGSGRDDGTGGVGLKSGVEHKFREEEEDLHIVDASLGVEEVGEDIWKVVEGRVEAVERGEVGRVVRRVS